MIRSDSEIWADVMSGNPAAWEELIRKYETLIHAVVTRSGLPFAEAADCFQQVWVALYTSRRKIKDPARLQAWLVTTAKREVLQLARSKKPTTGTEGLEDMASTDLLPDAELEQIEMQAMLQRALSQLDARCERLLKALFFSPINVTYRGLADALQISMNTLGPARKRCLDRLRKILEESEFLDARKND